jgi:hypothetical protein
LVSWWSRVGRFCDWVVSLSSTFVCCLAVRFSDALPCLRLFLAFVRMTTIFGIPRARKLISLVNLINLRSSGSLTIVAGLNECDLGDMDFQLRVLGSTWNSGLDWLFSIVLNCDG